MLQSASPFYPLSEGLQANEVDPRMPIWMTEHGAEVMESTSAPEDTFYSIGPSRAIIVHEIVRGNWTWCTAWSPDGGRLALATENHHLAVVETTASTVWRVRHDQRLSGPVKNGTTHSIRSIAWGQNFIAIGGTGNAVSILAPIEPYPVLHTILDTGFVGSLCWRRNSTVLAIGNRDDKCLVVNVSADDGDCGRHIQSNILETITRPDWVNSVAFSPGGTALAVGDRSGTLALYNYERKMPTDPPTISFLREFLMEDSVLSVEWSANGKWLYAGGEEFSVSVIDTTTWTVVREIPRKKWVHFISSSNRGTHVAVGGVASEVSIFDAENDWEEAISIELKGMVPLSASWHPQDQYLALTGQNNSVIAVETTNARHVHGHCLHSISPVLEVEFSPDGQMIVIGNEAGVVSFFCLEGSVFVTTYEMVLTSGESQSIRWSRDGQYVVIGTGDQVIIVSKISDQKMEKMPPGASGFSVRKVIRGLGKVRSISIDDTCRYVAVGGTTTRILDAADQFSSVREWKKRIVQCNAFSPDGTWLASIGRNENLTIYNTSAFRVDKWRVVFTLKAERAGLALAWGPAAVKGLQYLAYGGANSMITILEIRTKEETWETVLEIPRAGVIHDLDWSNTGMLAAAIGDGTVTIIDLEYLQSGWAMNEMDYTWQRQGITCLTEIRRNKGKNSMRTVRWIPSLDQSLIAIGGTDGSLEIVDLTERKRCGGFLKATSQRHMAVN
jgi:WD40 repeat protein